MFWLPLTTACFYNTSNIPIRAANWRPQNRLLWKLQHWRWSQEFRPLHEDVCVAVFNLSEQIRHPDGREVFHHMSHQRNKLLRTYQMYPDHRCFAPLPDSRPATYSQLLFTLSSKPPLSVLPCFQYSAASCTLFKPFQTGFILLVFEGQTCSGSCGMNV